MTNIIKKNWIICLHHYQIKMISIAVENLKNVLKPLFRFLSLVDNLRIYLNPLIDICVEKSNSIYMFISPFVNLRLIFTLNNQPKFLSNLVVRFISHTLRCLSNITHKFFSKCIVKQNNFTYLWFDLLTNLSYKYKTGIVIKIGNLPLQRRASTTGHRRKSGFFPVVKYYTGSRSLSWQQKEILLSTTIRPKVKNMVIHNRGSIISFYIRFEIA